MGFFKIVFGFMLLIGIHELGHAIAAILCGVKVKRFSIGMGPGLTFKNVPFLNELILSPIVIGGYVLLDDETLAQKSLWKRLFVLTGGMLANTILASVLFLIGGESLVRALVLPWFIWFWGWPLTFQVLTSGQIPIRDAVSGPVGIGGMMTSETYPYAFVLALISASLAMFNLLPLPPLDGGLMLTAILEKIIGKKWAQRIHSVLLVVGIVLLLSILVFATINDVTKLRQSP